MKNLLKVLILNGLAATGSYDGCLVYIEEQLTGQEVVFTKDFFEYLKANNLEIGRGNIDDRWNAWKKSLKTV